MDRLEPDRMHRCLSPHLLIRKHLAAPFSIMDGSLVVVYDQISVSLKDHHETTVRGGASTNGTDVIREKFFINFESVRKFKK